MEARILRKKYRPALPETGAFSHNGAFLPWPRDIPHNTLFSSLPRGALAYAATGKHHMTVLVTRSKPCKEHIFEGTVIDATDMRLLGQHSRWCADAFFTAQEFPCNNSKLRAPLD